MRNRKSIGAYHIRFRRYGRNKVSLFYYYLTITFYLSFSSTNNHKMLITKMNFALLPGFDPVVKYVVKQLNNPSPYFTRADGLLEALHQISILETRPTK